MYRCLWCLLYLYLHCQSKTDGRTTTTYSNGAPRNVRVATRNATNVLIEWDVPDHVNGTVSSYRVDYGNKESRTSNSTSILLTDLKPHTSYTYIVRALVTTHLQNGSLHYVWGNGTLEKSFTTRQAKPSSPRSLSVIKRSLTSASVTVDWQAPVSPNGCNSYVINYRVGNYTVATFTSDSNRENTNVVPPYTLSGLNPFTSYTVWVQAVNIEGSSTLESKPSNLQSFRTLTDAPSQPQKFRYKNLQNTSIRFLWDPPLNLNGVIAKYIITLAEGRSVNPHTHSNKSLTVLSVDGKISTTTLTNLTELTLYSAWTVAVNVREIDGKKLTSPPSRVEVFVTQTRSAPRAVRSNVSDASALIMWKTPLNLSRPVMSYRVSYYNASSNPSKPINYEYVYGSNSVTLFYLRPSTNYKIEIKAVVGKNLFTSSVYHSFTTSPATTSQSCKTPTVKEKSSSSIHLSFSCPSGDTPQLRDCHIKRYFIKYRPYNSSSSFIGIQLLSSMSQLDNLIPFTSYEILLIPDYDPLYCNIIFAPSPSLVVKTDPVGPTAPRNIREKTRNARDVVIEWDVPKYVNGTVGRYRVYLFDNKTYLPFASTSIRIRELKPFTRYTYIVQALVEHERDNGPKLSLWGESSPKQSFTTLQAEPSPPLNLSVNEKSKTSTSVTIDWHLPLSPNGNNIYVINYRVGSYNISTSTADTKQTNTGATPPYTLTGLQPFTSYTVWVRAVNKEESSTLESDPSNLQRFKTLTDAPSQPQRLRYMNTQRTSVYFMWDPPLHLNGVIEKYNIMLAEGRSVNPRTHGNKSLAVQMTVNGSISNTTPMNLTELTWYSVWIVAVNVRKTDGKQLTSPPSDVKVFGTPGGPLSAPRSVRSNVSDVSVVITWVAPLNLTSESSVWYRVSYYNTSSSNPAKEIYHQYISGRENKLVTFYYLRPSTNYRTKIMAHLGNDLWTGSVTHDFKTKAALAENISRPCKTPTATKKSTSSVDLSLYCPSGNASHMHDCHIKKYCIKYRLYNSGNRSMKRTLTSSSSFQLNSLLPFTFYEIRLIGVYDPFYCNIFFSPSPPLIIKTDPVAPLAPTNVRETTTNARDVVIEWSEPTYVNGSVSRYRVGYINGKYISSSSTSINLTNLNPYTTYTYTVQALLKHTLENGSIKEMWGEKSLVKSFTTRQAKPSPPRDLSVMQSNLTSASVTVDWQAPVSPNGRNTYVINYRVGSCTAAIVFADSSQKETNLFRSYTLSGLQPFTFYKVWVQAVNKEESSTLTSESSNVEAFTTLTDAPSQPQHLQYVNPQSTSVRLQWHPPLHLNGAITKYNIMLANGRFVNPQTHSSKSLAVSMTVDGNITNTAVINLTQLTWYSAWIVAVNVRETDGIQLASPPSDAAVFPTPGGPLSAPRTVRSNASGVSAVITWERPLNLPRPITRYRVSYYNVSSDPSKQIDYRYIKSKHPKSVTFYHLRPYTNYRTKIKAILENELWTRSVFYNFATKQTAPSPPQNVQTTAVGARSVTVRWSPPLHANGVLSRYKVFIQTGRSESPSGSGTKVEGSLNSPPRTNATLSKLSPVTPYRVWVAAVNVEDGELISQLAGPVTFTTIVEAPSPPRNVSFSNVTSNAVAIMWSPPSIIYGSLAEYNVSLMPSLGGPVTHSVIVSANNLSTAIENLVPFTHYIVEVRAGTFRDVNHSRPLLWSNPDTNKQPVVFATKQTFPSSPVNVTITRLSSRSVWIWWDGPEHPNGNIQSYSVVLFEKRKVNGSFNTHEHKYTWALTRANRTKNGGTQVEVNALSPYTQYNVTVYAVNIMDGFELVGEKSRLIEFRTEDEEPAAPFNCSIVRQNATFVHVSWQPPQPIDYQVSYYDVMYTSDRDAEPYSMTVYNHQAQVSSLLPFTEYNLTVTAFTNNNLLRHGPPCYLKTRTQIGAPPAPRKPQILFNATSAQNTVTLILPALNETNGPIRFVQIIVVELKRGVKWCETTPLPKLGDRRIVKLYVAKNLSTGERDKQFVVGANQDSNVQLKPNTTYAFYIRWIAQEELQGSDQRLMSISRAMVYSTAPLLYKKSSSNSVYLVPVILLLLLLVIIAVILLVMWIRRKKVNPKGKYDVSDQGPSGLHSTDLPLEHFSATQTNIDGDDQPAYATCMKVSREKKEVPIAEFERHVEGLKVNDNEGFIAEFEELAGVGSEQTCDFASKREHMKKNRYQNIVPYDGHCLMLDEVDGMDTLDTQYINATYLDGLIKSNEYIVTQGPLFNTYADFWRMVWIEKAETVVMLTRTVETGKKKCYQYWSDDEPILCEGLTVEVELLTEMAEYSVRRIRLKLRDEFRAVTHYHFKTWPDHGVPAHATDLLGFIYRVKRDVASSSASPLVVHCSAGAGRTGAYVTIDSLVRCLHELNANQRIDVKSIVSEMRTRRTEMVQSVKQYILIHDAVLEAYYTSTTEIPVVDFSRRLPILQETYSDLSGIKKIEQEFATLIKISPPPDQSGVTSGLRPTAMTRKNRDSSFIPPDLVCVTLKIDDDSEQEDDCINASFINGYYKRRLFIVTEPPLQCTTTSMWKLVYEQGASAIVNLAQPDKNGQYWPESGSQSYGHLKVDLMSSDIRKTFTVYKMQVFKSESMSQISLFHFTSWPNDAPPYDISGIVEMTKQLKQWMAENNGRRIIVHCSNDMERTGVFCAVYNILDQMCEGIVNVLHVAKLLRNQRPGIIHTPEQYETIYEIVDRCQQSEVIYANLT